MLENQSQKMSIVMKVDRWGYRNLNREGCGVEMKQILLKKAWLFEPSNALVLRQAWTRWSNSITTRCPIDPLT